ncbi:MAG: hypothetical protein KGQ59_03285 [Bdellovibrionales bacterium]|nr:hypothetical protein [Bdellovibrionales bacterium]
MSSKQFQILKVLFWAALGITVIGLLGSITDKVIQVKNATRTEQTPDRPIAVPAEPKTDTQR